ncbi:MAG: TRAP transporter small permease [Lachnospiraceae bacterium]|nr:TRAP transporter small permease [Lachnospiraceae bacterium]
MMCVILLQTFTRYVIFYSLPWSEELSRYLFIGMICLGVNIGVSKDLMIRIDAIDTKLNEAQKRWFSVGYLVLELFTSIFLFISTFDMVRIGKLQRSAAMRIPMNYMYLVFTVGYFLAILAILLKLYQTVQVIRNQKEGS